MAKKSTSDMKIISMQQQGDVLFKEISKKDLPAKLKKREARDGRIIFAEGEATGHHHSTVLEPVSVKTGKGKKAAKTEAPNCELFEDETGRLFAVVNAPEITVTHQEHGKVSVKQGLYWVDGVREYDPYAEAVRKVRD